MLLVTSLSINERNKNAIIASNLAREQIELFRNIRDTNYKKLQVWNQMNPLQWYSVAGVFTHWNYYTLENDFTASFSTKLRWLWGTIPEWPSNLPVNLAAMWNNTAAVWSNPASGYRLCIDPNNYYVYCPTTLWSWFEETPFYRYLYIDDKDMNWVFLEGNNATETNTYRVVSKVIWYKRGYHEFEMQTIVADWRRI